MCLYLCVLKCWRWVFHRSTCHIGALQNPPFIHMFLLLFLQTIFSILTLAAQAGGNNAPYNFFQDSRPFLSFFSFLFFICVLFVHSSTNIKPNPNVSLPLCNLNNSFIRLFNPFCSSPIHVQNSPGLTRPARLANSTRPYSNITSRNSHSSPPTASILASFLPVYDKHSVFCFIVDLTRVFVSYRYLTYPHTHFINQALS